MHTKKGIVNAHWAPPANNRTPPPRDHAPGVTFSGHSRQFIDAVPQDYGFGGRVPEEMLKGLEGAAVAHEGYSL